MGKAKLPQYTWVLVSLAIPLLLVNLWPSPPRPTPEQLNNATQEANYWKAKCLRQEPMEINVTASAYKFHGRQTANGTIVTKGHIAVSRDLREALLNEKVELRSLDGELIGTFLVTDIMAPGIRNSVDIYMTHGATSFGRKPVTLRILTKTRN